MVPLKATLRICAWVLLGSLGGNTVAVSTPVAFNRDILPILSDRCFTCHGPDAPARKAGLRLDVEGDAKAPRSSGGAAIVPGDVGASLVMQRILAEDPDRRMPPVETGDTLSTAEKDLLASWIEAGAAWEAHWAFIPPKRPAVPAVDAVSWPKNPIDHFVLAQLESERLSPSPEADRHTLIRRVTLALTGLPPSPKEIAHYLTDTAPGAYERLVERLLASPRYGEHMARYWLDLARYADTNGYAADIERTMWRYRDWVIAAFNENMPFDQFTIEQLAGDLLPEPTLAQRIATGFNRNHPIMMEGGAIYEEYRVMNVVDRVDTTATAWLGLTMKCAQCHDHKYDPVSQREFYEFYAFFNNISEEESRLFGTELDGNSVPRIKAPLPEQQAEMARIEDNLRAVRTEMLAPDDALDRRQGDWERAEREALVWRWSPLETKVVEGNDGTSHVELQGVTGLRAATALWVELLPAGEPDRAPVALGEVELYIAPLGASAAEQRVAFAASDSITGRARLACDGSLETAWHVAPGPHPAGAIFSAAKPYEFEEGTRIRVVLRGDASGAWANRVRLAVTSDPRYLPATLGPWRVNGPYTEENGDDALASDYVDPASIDLAATDEGGQPRWNLPEGGLPDGKAHPLPGKTCATWLHRTITAPAQRQMELSLDNRNAVRLWVNGRLVLDKEAQRGEVGAHPAPVTVNLREGENSILVKVVDYYDFNTHTFYFKRTGENIGPMSMALQSILMADPAARSPLEADGLRAHYRARHWDGWERLFARERDLLWAKSELEKTIPTTMVMEERAEPRPAHVLIRGEYDQPGEEVSPGVPSVLHAWPKDAPRNRLGLAQWLVAPENPLTARVAVNRYWQRALGEGLVRTPEDFGVQGARPSHPELLDWLAREFVASGWDVKALQRLIVTSATFRQASRHRSELAERDPGNRLLARGPRFRLDAEMVRDSALSASGLLVESLGGPSVKPYQPAGLWKDVAYGGGGLRYTAQEFIQDHGEALYRRSLYTFWKRAAAPPGMLVFDAPNRDVCTVRRGRSNTPLQALVLMNDTQYVEAARALAERVLVESGPDTETRLAHACALVLGRPPSPRETEALLRQYTSQLADYRAASDAAKALLASGESDYDTSLDVAELAAWTMVASALLNTDGAVSQF